MAERKSLYLMPCVISRMFSRKYFYFKQICLKFYARKSCVGVPWWRSEESICQCRGHRFEPWSGKIPHAAEQLSLCATTTEPAYRACEPRLLSPWATTTGKKKKSKENPMWYLTSWLACKQLVTISIGNVVVSQQEYSVGLCCLIW